MDGLTRKQRSSLLPHASLVGASNDRVALVRGETTLEVLSDKYWALIKLEEIPLLKLRQFIAALIKRHNYLVQKTNAIEVPAIELAAKIPEAAK